MDKVEQQEDRQLDSLKARIKKIKEQQKERKAALRKLDAQADTVRTAMKDYLTACEQTAASLHAGSGYRN